MHSQPTALEQAASKQRRRIPGLRWSIAVLLFLAAILNYIDRQTLSILAPTIQVKLRLSDQDYGQVVSLFLIAYTVSLLVSGRIVDWLGARVSMAVFITWWSLSNISTIFARGAASLGLCRFSLALGEAGNWPASTKVVSEWFPPKERAFAIGFYTLGATIGATLAPVLVNLLAERFGWQAAFVATGFIAITWVLIWIVFYRRPEQHPRITPRELELIRAGTTDQPAQIDVVHESELARWKQALSQRAVWGLMLGRLLSDPVWFFYQFWFAKYLFSARAVSQKGLSVTTFVYLAADIGSLLGGIASGLLIKRKVKTAWARWWVMLACATCMPVSFLVPAVPSLYLVIGIGMVVVFAHLAWLANISALVVDLIPRRLVATCFGIVAAGSALGGLMMNRIVQSLAEKGRYHDWFIAMGILHPVALLIVWLLAVRPVSHEKAV